MAKGYMANLLEYLGAHFGVGEDALKYIEKELIRSFRNGVQVGLERAGKGRVDEKNSPRKMGL